jgi:tRNA modification GTPase
MIFHLDDTIAAIATAPGGALRGIIRLSGPKCVSIVNQVILPEQAQGPDSRRFASCIRGTLPLPREVVAAPVTLYLWPTSSSYTRQPSAEFHLPGSPPLLEAALRVVCQAGARLARPGEFTLRAFLAGRLDLTQAEAVLGVIDARGQHELDHALAQLAGGLAGPLGTLRETLFDLLAQLEAGLDFVDEDIEFISQTELERKLAAAAQLIEDLADRMQTRGEAGLLPHIALMGRPNVGKSSLLNTLAGSDAAIVSETAGTTRDVVTRRVRIGDRDCLIADTAGVSCDATQNELDRAAQDAARRQVQQADLTLLCIDRSQPLTVGEMDELNRATDKRLVILTKGDLPPHRNFRQMPGAIHTSSINGAGIGELRGAIARALDTSHSEAGVLASTSDRCRESLRRAGEALERARATASMGGREELIASEVRVALDELGRVVGAVYTKDILDRVFSRFCIGK